MEGMIQRAELEKKIQEVMPMAQEVIRLRQEMQGVQEMQWKSSEHRTEKAEVHTSASAVRVRKDPLGRPLALEQEMSALEAEMVVISSDDAGLKED